jgi:hypothetical protein
MLAIPPVDEKRISLRAKETRLLRPRIKCVRDLANSDWDKRRLSLALAFRSRRAGKLSRRTGVVLENRSEDLFSNSPLLPGQNPTFIALHKAGHSDR